MTATRLAHPRFWLALFGLIVLLAVLTLLSPADRQLGTVVRIVFLHVAFTRAGIIFVEAAGLLGLILLARPVKKLMPWVRIGLVVGIGLYIAGFIISAFAQIAAWGGIAWMEPRVIAASQVMVVWLMALIVVFLWNNPPVHFGIAVVLAVFVTWSSTATPNVLHPGNAIGTSPSFAILLFPVLMLLVAVLIGTWLSWSVRPSPQ